MTSEIPSFVSRGWYRVRGRGWCCATECDRERPRTNSGLLGPVRIDGEDFICTAVEMFMPLTPLHAGEKIGLLVKEP